ncbi:MAG: HAMP domain-containing protein [Cytophagales bacterium]|nr:HAMP domain-containing protein [Rhizobacter sp.]
MSLNNLKIGARLSIGFGAVLSLLLVMMGVAYFQMEQTARSMTKAESSQQRASTVDDWQRKTQLNLTRVVAIAKAAGQPDVEAYFNPLMKQTSQEITQLQAAMEAAVDSDSGRSLMAAIAQKRDAYVALRTQLYEHVKVGDPFAAESLLKEKLLPAAQAYQAAMGDLQATERKNADAQNDGLRSDLTMAKSVLVVLALVSLCVGGAMAFLITRSVTAPIRQAVTAARVIASNDLSQRLDSTRRDELGDLLRALSDMQGSLHLMVGQVRSSTDSISTASAEIATGNQDLSARTEQTASNLQETASSMKQLTSTVRNSADSARQANQLASSAAEVAARGGMVVSQVVTTMDEINASSKKISDIIGVIDGIAFQTNILALNAAVEAARAGEQGRGFAVVASEVRSLAGRSAQAAKEIKGLIAASVDRVEVGSRLVADAGTTMNEIVNSVQRVSNIIGEITVASSQQSDGIGQVNTAVTQLDQMTQQNAALVEESAAAAESLKEQAARLAQVISTFQLHR